MTKPKENGTDLSLISTEALWDELAGRYDSAVFARYQDKGAAAEDAQVYYKGSAFVCKTLGWAIDDQMADFIRCGRNLEDK